MPDAAPSIDDLKKLILPTGAPPPAPKVSEPAPSSPSAATVPLPPSGAPSVGDLKKSILGAPATAPKPPAAPAETLWQSLTKPGEGFGEGAIKSVGGWATHLWDSLLAGEQGVKTDATGAKLAPEKEQFLLSEQGTVSDQRKYFAGRDPKTGKISAFERTPGTEAGFLERGAQLATAAGTALPERFPIAAGAAPSSILPKAQLAQDFRTAGVPSSVPAVTGSRLPTFVQRQLGKLPMSPVGPAMSRAESAIGEGVEQTAGRFGQVSTPEDAGNVVSNALQRYAADKSQAKADYALFWNLMHRAPDSPITNTLQMLKELRGRFPNAPELEGIFQNPTIRTLTESLTPRQVNIPAQTSAMLDQYGRPIVTAAARVEQRGGQLSMPELRDLHTRIGNMIEDARFLPDTPGKADLRRLNNAINTDIVKMAQQQSPQAARALQRANIDYGTRMRIMENLEPLVKTPGGAATFARLNQAAQSRIGVGQPGTTLLQTAKNAIKPEEWNEFAGAVVRNLGKPTAAQAKLPGANENFSIHAFTDNFAKLSDKAKDLIFGAERPGSPRSGLELMARVAKAQTRLGKPPEPGGWTQLIESVIGTAGVLAHPIAAGSSIGGAYLMSKLLMTPWFTQFLYRLPEVIAQRQGVWAAREQATNLLQQAANGKLPPVPPPKIAETGPPQRRSSLSIAPQSAPYVGTSGL